MTREKIENVISSNTEASWQTSNIIRALNEYEKESYNQALEDFIHAYYKYCEIQYGILADDELVDMLKIKEKLIK